MLRVKPENRPSCDQIISMPLFIKRAQHFFPLFVQNYAMLDQSILLKTIRLPNSLMKSEEGHFWNDLSQRLPRANYEKKVNESVTEDIYDLASNRSLLHLKNDSISKVNLP